MLKEIDFNQAIASYANGKRVMVWTEENDEVKITSLDKLLSGVRFIIDDHVEEVKAEPVKEEVVEEAPAEPEAKPVKKKPSRKPFNYGKFKALYNAGWSLDDIITEIGCSKATAHAMVEELKMG